MRRLRGLPAATDSCRYVGRGPPLQDCLEFVQREFPQYWEAYRWLGPGVERADFFR